MTRIKISSDFSRAPAGRYHPHDGDKTGERFRSELLVRYLKQSDDELEIDLDGAIGYPSSFLEEAFGGLVREGFSVELLRKRLKIVASEPRKQRYIPQIWEYISEARASAVA